ncbi:MAG: O-methyltransferase [Candidatus Dormibacteraeota bacterium]|nr:O-methyltransferase [Candidatus Dormibacteraeota bacterium]
MPFTDQDLAYLEVVHAPIGLVLNEMLEVGRAEQIPILQPAAGRVLRVLVMALNPKRVLEIGTAIGFSTLWMASALAEGARIDTIDPDRGRTDRARRYWLRAGVTDKVRVINEPALRVLPRLAPGIEFAFIDAIKTEYAAYLEALLPKMAPGGVITVDNLLWSGRIAAGADDGDTSALRAFNEVFLHHEQLEATILPVGDGLGVGVVRPHA